MLHKIHWVPGLAPVADAFAGTATTDVVKVNGEGALFLINKGVGATGTSTITILACDDVTPTTTAAVAFMYRVSTTPDTWGDWTRATTAGFATTAGSAQVYEIYVEASELASEGSDGYAYVQLSAAEVVDSPVLAGIMIGIVNPRFADVDSTQIT